MIPVEPSGGFFDGKIHMLPVRVYYEDTDFSGVVYHATYLRFMERGRSEFLRSADVRHQGMLKTEQPLVWVVRRIEVDYLKPARVDDALAIRSEAVELTGARLKLHQEVRRGDEVLVKAAVEACVITLDGRPQRVPEDIAVKLRRFL